jgi:hypothetical protein
VPLTAASETGTPQCSQPLGLTHRACSAAPSGTHGAGGPASAVLQRRLDDQQRALVAATARVSELERQLADKRAAYDHDVQALQGSVLPVDSAMFMVQISACLDTASLGCTLGFRCLPTPMVCSDPCVWLSAIVNECIPLCCVWYGQ